MGLDGFEVKSETERFTVVCPRCRFDEYGRECLKMRAARAARSFWFFQTIILLLFGVVVALAVVVS